MDGLSKTLILLEQFTSTKNYGEQGVREDLTRDTPVMVVAQDGLELIVEKAKNEDIQYQEVQK